MTKWIDITKQYPDPVNENKVLGHNGSYAFECEFDDGFWCNIGGDEMTHWMPLPEPPTRNQTRQGNIEMKPLGCECTDCPTCNGRVARQQKRINELEGKLIFLINNDSINDSSIEKEVLLLVAPST